MVVLALGGGGGGGGGGGTAQSCAGSGRILLSLLSMKHFNYAPVYRVNYRRRKQKPPVPTHNSQRQ
ncbi:hypothetical protein JYU34_004610 [Plutella xylostella]|uniref:Secreted protein n=1 Tax=Plutella xylostella TaxID=51655 RepID=A0ABQ7QYE6_PLUXY|nr:hypothetical protein JYU34_004610 [Plutella xylostella]